MGTKPHTFVTIRCSERADVSCRRHLSQYPYGKGLLNELAIIVRWRANLANIFSVRSNDPMKSIVTTVASAAFLQQLGTSMAEW
jgi:hypothetical protein